MKGKQLTCFEDAYFSNFLYRLVSMKFNPKKYQLIKNHLRGI